MHEVYRARRLPTPRAADLVGRYLATLQSASGHDVSREGLIEALRLDTLDWRLDHGLVTMPPRLENTDVDQGAAEPR